MCVCVFELFVFVDNLERIDIIIDRVVLSSIVVAAGGGSGEEKETFFHYYGAETF